MIAATCYAILMIYITGDTHNTIDMSNLSTKNMKFCCKKFNADYHNITTAIVLGDFGLPWSACPVDERGIHPKDKTDRYLLKWYNSKPFKVLAVMGNHENYDMIEKLPEIEMFGSKVLKVSKNIFYLKRGEVYTIEGNKFLVLGGARSQDKAYRIPHESWWPQEELSEEEKRNCFIRIKESGGSFDYVLSHNGTSQGIACLESMEEVQKDSTVSFNDEVACAVTYRKWFFGHWHIDMDDAACSCSKDVPLYKKGIVI